ncbi:hypothetical protein CUJ83_04590 [Methanocella sp. CWC-04]|uniref:Uncharacterized protein n=1 Tax=Methanooceanicella nereidis TaxID=2052831 RepID=A0AAP2RB55_9EURY|nr:hypothetical protein [Methanocella sp. CWC-04]MCD1294274.1 hypothetical protein [Methanocella sp. CWC-04]
MDSGSIQFVFEYDLNDEHSFEVPENCLLVDDYKLNLFSVHEFIRSYPIDSMDLDIEYDRP